MILRMICNTQIDKLSQKVLQEYEQDAAGEGDALILTSGTSRYSDWCLQAAVAVRTEELRCWHALRRWLGHHA